MIYILPSADYELYLGQIFAGEGEVLIEPTDRLMEMFESIGQRMTLFCDVACIWRYREWGKETIATAMERQMRDALSRGHDVQAHLHPHWLQTELIDGRYVFPAKEYLLGTLDSDEERCRRRVFELLVRSRDYLHGLLRSVDPGYRCIAFRAGGYGLQPRERMVLAALIKAGFGIDSSIIPGFTFKSSTHSVDFTATPTLANYWLGPKEGLSRAAPEGEGVFEIPIPAIRLTKARAAWINFPEAFRQAVAILRGRDPDNERKGEPCGGEPALVTSRWRRAYWRSRAMMRTQFHRLEAGPSLRHLQTVLDVYVRSLPAYGQDIYLSVNSHPKGMTPRHGRVLKNFIERVGDVRGKKCQCITFQKSWEQVQSAADFT